MLIEHAICGRSGLTYKFNIVFKSESIDSCMHTQVAINGVPELTRHVKYESFLCVVQIRGEYDKCLTLVSNVCSDV